MTTGADSPPSFQPNTIDLVSVKDSKITGVSLYSSRAEITRSFRFSVKVGLNQVNINGLPNVLDQHSLKVEGTGRATIHDVIISTTPFSAKPSTSDKLDELRREKKKTEDAIARCSLGIQSLKTYIGTLNVKDVNVSEAANIVKTYQTTGGELDDQLTDLQDQLVKLNLSVVAEQLKLAGPGENAALGVKATVWVFAENDGEVEIKLIYAVYGAHWHALYDVRVDMQTKEKPVELTYKAAITQQTGEDWADVNLTLETAEPTFGLGIPQLVPWTVSVYRPAPPKLKSKKRAAAITLESVAPEGASRAHSQFHSYRFGSQEEYGGFQEEDGIRHQETTVNSRGSVTATFGVPGQISVPSDGATHNVTVVKLNLDAKMSWVSVPKQEAKTHLSAKVKNASEYTLLGGQASVYVDGSFIARTNIPPVSPEESFDCPLGLDPSIRITYHPRTKKTTRSGFYNKTTTQVFVQRINIFNTKTTSIDSLKVTDQFPVSDDSIITVKQVTPGFTDVVKESTGGELKIPDPVKVSSGVTAQWHSADEADVNVESLGKDGKFDWVCVIPPQGKIDLVLQFEVVSPPHTQITGL